ncbi:Ribosome biogenesis protein [Bacidia gigantensis]|uniref:Ribosome biogenesis protein n=1 Tax=Bacidia gigantensis TaxID=2732470 RepID=UPI001D056B42|nr:Ribosome biogenesis protein [Bacidia gigantensis]KAG8530876.1 Ribosome biogenesis protein [Bacidia gigantensis]
MEAAPMLSKALTQHRDSELAILGYTNLVVVPAAFGHVLFARASVSSFERNVNRKPQNEYIERFQREHGKRFDHEERVRKRAARETHKISKDSQKLTGLRAKLYQKTRHQQKIQMKKSIKAHEEKNVKSSGPPETPNTAIPQYLLDRGNENNAKALSSAIKNKRNEKAAKFSVPLPKVKGISEEEMFKVVKTGSKTKKKSWKRMITKPTFGEASSPAEQSALGLEHANKSM